MVWIFLIILFGAIGIGIRMGSKSAQEQKKLLAEGKILRRQYNFVESAEEFSLLPVIPDNVENAVQAFDYEDMNVHMQHDEKGFHFAGQGWTAKLFGLPSGDQQSKYRFEFLKWKTRNDILQDYVNMNKLTTAIERMFLKLDPKTQVSIVPLEVKTRHSII